jgi:hypothetical protein
LCAGIITESKILGNDYLLMQIAFNGIRHYDQQKRLHVVVSERGLNDRKNTAKKKKRFGRTVSFTLFVKYRYELLQNKVSKYTYIEKWWLERVGGGKRNHYKKSEVLTAVSSRITVF